MIGIKMTADDLQVKRMWHYPPRYKLHLCIGLLFIMICHVHLRNCTSGSITVLQHIL